MPAPISAWRSGLILHEELLLPSLLRFLEFDELTIKSARYNGVGYVKILSLTKLILAESLLIY